MPPKVPPMSPSWLGEGTASRPLTATPIAAHSKSWPPSLQWRADSIQSAAAVSTTAALPRWAPVQLAERQGSPRRINQRRRSRSARRNPFASDRMVSVVHQSSSTSRRLKPTILGNSEADIAPPGRLSANEAASSSHWICHPHHKRLRSGQFAPDKQLCSINTTGMPWA